LGIAERVSFIGFISDEARNLLFKVADCAVFPSLYEPFGIVALEAMALGCPVVASDVGGLSEVVTYRDTGITIYPDDPHSVAWGVIRALTEPDWVQEHIVRARQRVKEEFNWGRIARQTINVYEQVLRLTA
jgi:glycosyltransferase involved in cell wall biosynthesis